MPLPRLLILPAFAALFALALTASPASAEAPACACADDFPLESPDLCYETPGPQIADFAYNFPSDFLQVVGYGPTLGFCRHNTSSVTWLDGPGTLACEEFLGCLCANPSPGPEVLCNGNDDDCNPATSDEPPAAACDTGLMGVCADGIEGCDAGGEACIQLVDAADEVCDDGVDNDCDGAVDYMDDDCLETCPCWGSLTTHDSIPVAWDHSFTATSCSAVTTTFLGFPATPPGLLLESSVGAGLVTVAGTGSLGPSCWSGIVGNVGGNDLNTQTKAACEATLRAIAAEDGVSCP